MQYPLPCPPLGPPPSNASHKKSIALPGPMTTTLVSPALASHNISSTTSAIQACGGGGTSPNSSVKVTRIAKQCFVLRQPNSRGPCWLVMRGTVLFFCLPLVHCSLGWLFCLAIHLKIDFRCSVT